jgi:hypothetical protein
VTAVGNGRPDASPRYLGDRHANAKITNDTAIAAAAPVTASPNGTGRS